MEYRNISKDIKTCDFNLPIPSKPIGFLVYSTMGFRAIARKITSRFVVLEIGSSYGVATEILSRRTKFVLGLETSSECIKEARSRYPHIQFEHIDCLGSPSIVKEKLCGMIANFVAADPVGENPRIVIFVDIGGNRESGALQKLLKFVETDLDPTYVVVKSQSLVQITPQETNVLKLGDLKQPVKKGKHKAHPLKQPPRMIFKDGDNHLICRYENYDPAEGCRKFRDNNNNGPHGPCRCDHDHCHRCREEGHIALDCPNSVSLY